MGRPAKAFRGWCLVLSESKTRTQAVQAHYKCGKLKRILTHDSLLDKRSRMAYAAIVIADAFRKVIGIRTARTFVKTNTLNANCPSPLVPRRYEAESESIA